MPTYHLWVGFWFVVFWFIGLWFGESCAHGGNNLVSPLHHQVQFVAGLPDHVLGLLVTHLKHVLSVDLDQVVSRLAAGVTGDTVKRNLEYKMGHLSSWIWIFKIVDWWLWLVQNNKWNSTKLFACLHIRLLKRGMAKPSFVCEGARKMAPCGRNELGFCM